MAAKKITGTIGLENTLSQTPERKRYDENGKRILKHKEVLANILKYSLTEYENCSCDEIMRLIEADSITQDENISPDSDSRIIGDDTVQSS